MPSEPYVVITPAGLNQLAYNHEINQILMGTYKIFRENPDITLPVNLTVKYVSGKVVVEMMEEEVEPAGV